MSGAPLNNPSPQFGTAEYVGVPGNDHCQYCHQPIASTYYRINEAMACAGCAEKMRGELAKDTHAAYMRGVLFGIGAALAGLILYAGFAIATGIIIGYVSLAVGWMVGKAMIKGSGGVGGRRYQVTAALLTYAAVSMAAIPVAIHYGIKHKQEHKSDNEFERQEQKVNPNFHPNSNANLRGNPNVERPSFGKAVAELAMIGIASPFLELWETGPNVSWIIRMVILLVGVRIAWRIAAGKPLVIFGPFENSPQPAR